MIVESNDGNVNAVGGSDDGTVDGCNKEFM
jgi:hypothetical protein